MVTTSVSWVGEVADEVVEFVARRNKAVDEPIVVASGISPSGPIHLGNLREVIVAHAVSEELVARGRAVRHLHFCDDYDRLRRVPASVPPEFEQYVGHPLNAIPDPVSDCHGSYAEHFIGGFDDALDRLRIRPEQIRQSEAYASGVYADSVRRAVEQRSVIEEVLARYRLEQEKADAGADADVESEVEPQLLPLRVYCENCGRDDTVARLPDEVTIDSRCNTCGHETRLSLDGRLPAKLVWKVDWPMRWAYYGVDFEPGGVDHSSPGSSYEVGSELVRRVYAGIAPHVGYSFVGIEGRSKLSSSHGDVPTPSMALRVLEPRILRWQYIRRRPQSSFSVSFGSEILRLYDEWDSLQKRMGEDKANPAEQVFYRMSVRTTAGDVAGPQVTVPFRILAAAADVTQGNLEQLFRVVRAQVGDDGSAGQIQEEVEPRLSCAIDWAVSFQPEDERTRVRSQPAGPSEVVMGDQNVAGLRLLLDRLDDHWSPDGLTTLVYGVPKLLGGLPLDAPTNDMIKKLQREFFVLLSTGCWSMRRPGRDSRPCSSPSGRSRWSASCRRSLNRRRPRLTLTRGGSDPDGAV